MIQYKTLGFLPAERQALGTYLLERERMNSG